MWHHQQGREFSRKWVKESPTQNLIQKIKAREGRKKRLLGSPFMVFKWKRRRKLTQEAAQVGQPSNKEEAKAVQKVEMIVEPQATTEAEDVKQSFQKVVESSDKEEGDEQVGQIIDENYPDQLYRCGNVKWFVQYIRKDTVENVKLILMPIINNQHWTLLVGAMQKRKWRLYDSLPNIIHLAITSDIIKQFLRDASEAFTSDLSQWQVVLAKCVPVQSNGVDCGVFVCKCMETLIHKGKFDWKKKSRCRNLCQYLELKLDMSSVNLHCHELKDIGLIVW